MMVGVRHSSVKREGFVEPQGRKIGYGAFYEVWFGFRPKETGLWAVCRGVLRAPEDTLRSVVHDTTTIPNRQTHG